MKALEWQKKRTTTLQTLRRDSDGYDVLREEENGFVFRRKRQKLPSQQKSLSKKKSSKKASTDLLPLADLLIDVLAPMMHHEVEEFISVVDDPSKAEKPRALLNAFIECVLTPTTVLSLVRAQETATGKGGDIHEMLREVCTPEICTFVETMQNGGAVDLEARLRRLAPKSSSVQDQIDVLQKRITSLKTECAQWNALTEDHWPADIPSDIDSLPLPNTSTSFSESDLEQITKDRQKLVLQCLEAQQSIHATEELCIEAENLFRDLQARHNHQEMASVLISDDPRIIIKNLLAL